MSNEILKYRIANPSSGVILGVYEGTSEDDALDAMAREAGYADYSEAQDAAPAGPDELIVTQVED
jgi:hypothetical protein